MFPALKYPPFEIRLKRNEKDEIYVLDLIRKRWLLLTPEEWVRQHLVNFLITVKRFPVGLISLEKEIILNNTKKRYDIVVYNDFKEPIIICECKAPEIPLNEAVLEQAMRYNLVLKVPYIIISNGISEVVFSGSGPLKELPEFSEIKKS